MLEYRDRDVVNIEKVLPLSDFFYIILHLFIISAATGPAICIILASYAGCDRTAAMVYFVLSMALMGGFYSGMKVRDHFIK